MIRPLALGIIGAVLGIPLGALVGLAGGTLWITVMRTSSFEGLSGYVVFYWIIACAFLGMIAGFVWGVTRR